MSRATFSSTPGLGKKLSPSFQHNHDYPKFPLLPHCHEMKYNILSINNLYLLSTGFRISCHELGKEAACQKEPKQG